DATIDWLVRCMESPATRWHGAYEFCWPGNEEVQAIPLGRLDRNHWKRLVDALLQTREFHHGDRLLLKVLQSLPEPRIDKRLKDELRRSLADADSFRGGLLMEVLIDRMDFKEGRILLDRLNGLDSTDQPGCR